MTVTGTSTSTGTSPKSQPNSLPLPATATQPTATQPTATQQQLQSQQQQQVSGTQESVQLQHSQINSENICENKENIDFNSNDQTLPNDVSSDAQPTQTQTQTQIQIPTQLVTQTHVKAQTVDDSNGNGSMLKLPLTVVTKATTAGNSDNIINTPKINSVMPSTITKLNQSPAQSAIVNTRVLPDGTTIMEFKGQQTQTQTKTQQNGNI